MLRRAIRDRVPFGKVVCSRHRPGIDNSRRNVVNHADGALPAPCWSIPIVRQCRRGLRADDGSNRVRRAARRDDARARRRRRRASGPPSDVRAAFFANWDRYGRGYFVNQIPADKLNVIDYAFAAPGRHRRLLAHRRVVGLPGADVERRTERRRRRDDPSNPDQHLFGNFNQLLKLKAAHPGLRVEMSLGGWTGSRYFSDVAATAASRSAFVSSCIDLIIKGNLPTGGWPTQAGGAGVAAGLFDGINVDWEYPASIPATARNTRRPTSHNATLLLQEFRRQLDGVRRRPGKAYTLTVDIPGGNVHSTGSWELPQVAKTVDWIDAMTFDFHGNWDAITAFNSPFAFDPAEPPVGGGAIQWTWNTAGSVAYFLPNRVPGEQARRRHPVLRQGVRRRRAHEPRALPGARRRAGERHADVSRPRRHGSRRSEPHSDRPDRSRRHRVRAINGFTRYFDLLAGAPWLYNPDVERWDVHQLRRSVRGLRARRAREGARSPRRIRLGDQQRRQRATTSSTR